MGRAAQGTLAAASTSMAGNLAVGTVGHADVLEALPTRRTVERQSGRHPGGRVAERRGRQSVRAVVLRKHAAGSPRSQRRIGAVIVRSSCISMRYADA